MIGTIRDFSGKISTGNVGEWKVIALTTQPPPPTPWAKRFLVLDFQF